MAIAAAIAHGADYVWVINNDIDFEPRTLLTRSGRHLGRRRHRRFVDVRRDPSISLFSERNAAGLFLFAFPDPQKTNADFLLTFEVSGAAVLLSRTLLQRRYEFLPTTWTDLFLYCEEFELALSLAQKVFVRSLRCGRASTTALVRVPADWLG